MALQLPDGYPARAQADVDGEAAQAEEELNARERQELAANGASPGDSDDDEGGGPAGPGSAREISMLRACRHVDEFQKLNRISEGTYGVVYRCVCFHVEPFRALHKGLLLECGKMRASTWCAAFASDSSCTPSPAISVRPWFQVGS
jgi:hypothetical protein